MAKASPPISFGKPRVKIKINHCFSDKPNVFYAENISWATEFVVVISSLKVCNTLRGYRFTLHS